MLFFAVPADDIDVAVVCFVDCYFTRGVRCTSHIPHTQRLVHRTWAKYLQWSNIPGGWRLALAWLYIWRQTDEYFNNSFFFCKTTVSALNTSQKFYSFLLLALWDLYTLALHNKFNNINWIYILPYRQLIKGLTTVLVIPGYTPWKQISNLLTLASTQHGNVHPGSRTLEAPCGNCYAPAWGLLVMIIDMSWGANEQ